MSSRATHELSVSARTSPTWNSWSTTSHNSSTCYLARRAVCALLSFVPVSLSLPFRAKEGWSKMSTLEVGYTRALWFLCGVCGSWPQICNSQFEPSSWAPQSWFTYAASYTTAKPEDGPSQPLSCEIVAARPSVSRSVFGPSTAVREYLGLIYTEEATLWTWFCVPYRAVSHGRSFQAAPTLSAQVVAVSWPSPPFEDAKFPSLYLKNAGA